AFKERFGHCDVPRNWPESRPLSLWVGTQRQFRKKGKLRPDQVERLARLGFIWDTHEAEWEEMFKALFEYRGEPGDSNVPTGGQAHSGGVRGSASSPRNGSAV